MHIPDGFLSTEVAATTAVVSAGVLGYSLKRADALLDERRVPLRGRHRRRSSSRRRC